MSICSGNQSSLRLAIASVLLCMAACSAPMPVPEQAPEQDAVSSEPAPASLEYSNKDFGRALAALKDGNLKKAEKLFLDLTQQQSGQAEAYSNLGIIYFRSERLNEAMQALKKATELDRQNHVAYDYLGIVQRNMGHFSEARSAYIRALEIKPDYAYAHLNLAMLYDLYLGDLGQALHHYTQYLELTGGDDKKVKGWLADLRLRMQSASSVADKERP